jgi:hypothetical protein
MKKILFFSLALAISVSSCKKKSNADEEEDPNSPFKLEYSNLTTEQHKQKIEESGIQFVEKLSSLPDQKFIDLLSYLAELGPSISSTSSTFAIGRAAKVKDLRGIFKAATSATSVSRLSENYKIYTWNFQTESFDETASNDRFEIRFPSDALRTSNNSVLTVTYVASNIIATVDGDSAELPASVTTTLKMNNKEELKITSLYEYKSDGTPTKVAVNLMMGVYTLKTKVANDGAVSSTELAFLKGAESLMSLNASANGNLSLNSASSSSNPDDIVKNANATFEIMNIKLAGMVDVKAVIDAKNAAGNLPVAERNQKEADAMNAHAKFVAVNKTDNTVIAKMQFESVSDQHCYFNGQTNQCYYDYYLEPRLIFKDGSKSSFDDFLDSGFAQLIDDLEEFGEKFAD